MTNEKTQENRPAATERLNDGLPTLEELESYCNENGYNIDGQQFLTHYQGSKRKLKSWQAAARTWARC